jgi:alpha-glucoside transport system permease protein
MKGIGTSIPALIIIGALLIPISIYAALGAGDRLLAGTRPLRDRLWRPWAWLAMPMLVVGVVLIYPLVLTFVYALANGRATDWVGFNNFIWAFAGDMRDILSNSLLWLIVLPTATLVLSLAVAVLFDKVRYERLAMTLIILPTAISFTAASVIWRQFFSYQPDGFQQLGVINALWTLVPGAQPVPWLQTPLVNSLCLVFVALWASLGVAALIVSAAVKNVPVELVEAARLDGAGAWRVLYHITLPSILPALLVVVTIQVIFALKVFDIVFVITNGNFHTDTMANRMYSELFIGDNLGHASAIAVILLIASLPAVFVNIRQFRGSAQ